MKRHRSNAARVAAIVVSLALVLFATTGCASSGAPPGATTQPTLGAQLHDTRARLERGFEVADLAATAAEKPELREDIDEARRYVTAAFDAAELVATLFGDIKSDQDTMELVAAVLKAYIEIRDGVSATTQPSG